MSDERGGAASEEGRLAPVIPLFGGRGATAGPEGSERSRPSAPVSAAPSTEAEWRSTWAEESAAERRGPSSRHPAAAALAPEDTGVSDRTASSPGRRGLRAIGRHGTGDASTSGDPLAEASELLVRKLRSKQLSSTEARDVLRENGVPADERTLLIEQFEQRGYLDDASLAELLVTAGSERKGQGRVAIARTLSQRGIPREIADEALSVLDDDDAERALDYVRSKVAGLRRYDEDTAIRRLVGQLSRRGYGGSVALTAARTAWRETQRGSGVGRVRFEES
ncbi:RecX family transcriptional regulator [Microbacterium sp. Au-Mic1]|uniref:regulatory protein RecX n=1 Tax=Microbacterium sp. Au-Mic1 TaxID=2906457 RepID=UPI001E48110C|nr:regulatory protein RecX [Microbacterium sp. Au-Mic1]MCE4024931.1 RecX family transcriptional regulator [Microbacterium sp. Au-Mic1]